MTLHLVRGEIFIDLSSNFWFGAVREERDSSREVSSKRVPAPPNGVVN